MVHTAMRRIVGFTTATAGVMVVMSAWSPSFAETICVKYGPCPIDLKWFVCTDTPRSSFVRTTCYDTPKRYMLIKLNEVWYHYCGIDAGTVDGLLKADFAGRYYDSTIKNRFDCRVTQAPPTLEP